MQDSISKTQSLTIYYLNLFNRQEEEKTFNNWEEFYSFDQDDNNQIYIKKYDWVFEDGSHAGNEHPCNAGAYLYEFAEEMGLYESPKAPSELSKKALKEGWTFTYSNEEYQNSICDDDIREADISYREHEGHSWANGFKIEFNGKLIHSCKTYKSLTNKLEKLSEKWHLELDRVW